MWRFLKRLLGVDDYQAPPASPDPVETESGDPDLVRYLQKARDAEEERQRVSAPYFATMALMQAKIKERDFQSAAAAARANLRQVPPFVRNWIEDAGELHVQSIPCLQEGGTMLALAGDREGLEELAEVVRSIPGLEQWADVPATDWESLHLIEAILAEVAGNPGCKQNTMKDRLGASDGRRIGNLIQWLEKAERVHRVKEGATYTIWPPGHSLTPGSGLSPTPDSCRGYARQESLLRYTQWRYPPGDLLLSPTNRHLTRLTPDPLGDSVAELREP